MIKRFALLVSLFSFQGLSAQKIESKSWMDSLKQQFYQYNVPYPEEAFEKNIEGTIVINFDIDSTCSFINRTQNAILGYGCDEIAWKTINTFERDYKKLNKNNCEATKGISLPVKFELK